MIRRTLLEWETLPYGPDPDDPRTIPPSMADRLAAIAARSPLSGRGGQGILEHGRTSLKARGVVGIIAAEGAALEILPKIDVGATEPGQMNAAIRRRLLHMLAVALDVRVDVGGLTELDWQRDTLLEILIRVFADQLMEAVRRGMPRRYVDEQDDLPTLRGALNVTRQFTVHAANCARLACRFDELSPDIALNQIMKAAVCRLARMAQSSGNQRRLRELAFIYADISEVAVAALRWDRVIIDRTNERWRDLLGLARLLLGNRFQTTSSGPNHGFSLLFEMSTLFEEFVGRLVGRALAGTDLQVICQGGRLYCLTEPESQRGLFQTKPDILIRRGGAVAQIIDTKWKRISARTDDPKRGVSQSDVYQMMAYGQLYRCPRLMLLYPHHPGLGPREGVHASHNITGHEALLQTASLDVAEGRGLVPRLRNILSFQEVKA